MVVGAVREAPGHFIIGHVYPCGYMRPSIQFAAAVTF